MKIHHPDTILLPARLDSLGRLARWVEAWCRRLRVADDTRFYLDLVTSEAATNIVNYAFGDDGRGEFEVSLELVEEAVVAELRDRGRAFDPLDFPEPAPPGSLDDAPLGGLGIHLIRSYASEVEYQRRDGCNILRIVVPRDTVPQAGARQVAGIARGVDRRGENGAQPRFPLRLTDGEVIDHDRRVVVDRRTNAFISQQALFRGVPWHVIEPIIDEAPIRRLLPGEVLISPGEENHHLYLVSAGLLRVHLDAADAEGGFPTEVGECTGDMSIIDGKLTSAYVVAEQPSEVIALHEKLFWDRVTSNPRMARNMMSMLVNRMRQRNEEALEAQARELRFQHLQKELDIARNIQLSMLPRAPLFDGIDGVEAHALMEPARSVGGDFYDAQVLDAGRVYIAIGDVSGKGVHSALFMARTTTLLRDAMARQIDPGAGLTTVNRTLCEGNNACMFATIFLAVVDLASGRFEFVSGGHNPVLLGNRASGYRFVDNPDGILVGIRESATFAVGRGRLAPGDNLALYTDGVTEAVGPSGEMFGEDRLRALLGTLPDDDPVRTVDGVRAAVAEFADSAAQSDDITLLVLHYRGR